MYEALASLGVVDYEEIMRMTRSTNPTPSVYTYIHRNFAIHLYNMEACWFDLFMYMWKRVYQWIFTSTEEGFKRKRERHVLYLNNRCNKVGLLNLKLQSI